MSEREDQIASLLLPLDRLPDPLPIPVIERAFDVVVRPPGSKSITNRALLLAALAEGTSELRGALVDADDARVMVRAVEQLGARIEIERAPSASSGVDIVRVTGVGGRWRVPLGSEARLDLGNAGTATRFLAAAAILPGVDDRPELHQVRGSAYRGPIVIDGDARMRERPIGELAEALREIGAGVEYLGKDGFPPIRVHPMGSAMFSTPCVRFGRTSSSQFISAVMLAAPWLPFGLSIEFLPEEGITSEPYISMTIEMLTRLGAPVLDRRPRGVHIGSTADIDDRPQPAMGPGVKPFRMDIEPDASGATYFEGAAALIERSRVIIEGLDVGPRVSLQGDARFVRVLTEMGVRVERGGKGLKVHGTGRLRPVDLDLADMPDTAMTAAVLACFADGPSTLRGLRTLRVKETDRLEALRVELGRVGASVEVFRDGDDECLRVTPPAPEHWSAQSGRPVPPIHFETYNDHRMAMALALVGLRRPGVLIRNPACVAKTYPAFWRDLATLYG